MIACTDLDDYLIGDLPDDRRRQFDVHLLVCPGCREAVHEHERLIALLRAAAESEPIPPGFADRVRSRVRRRRRMRLGALAGTVAAAAAFVWVHNRRLNPPLPDRAADDRAVAVTPAEVRVTFPGSNVLAVREPAASPGMTFVWVYPNLSQELHKSRNRR
jgi:anti-sigma factor RsiW